MPIHQNILGKQCRDKITGFSGIATGRAEYLYGCTQFCLVPPAKDGEIKGAEWFDEGRIDVIADGVIADEVRGERNGGPNRDAPRC